MSMGLEPRARVGADRTRRRRSSFSGHGTLSGGGAPARQVGRRDYAVGRRLSALYVRDRTQHTQQTARCGPPVGSTA